MYHHLRPDTYQEYNELKEQIPVPHDNYLKSI